MTDVEIIKRLDYALTMLIGIDNVDLVYQAKNDKDVEDIILNLKEETMKVELDKEQIELILDALTEYEQKYFDSRDDMWQGVMNDTISQLQSITDKDIV